MLTLSLFEYDLQYISLEQTGKINRVVNFCLDFYSVGIIFYYLVLGRYPFDIENMPNKLIHMTISEEPPPFDNIDLDILLQISLIVLKLMNNNLDLLYQPTRGIIHNIDLTISEYEPGVDLEIAQYDISKKIIILQKLYGHANEYSKLLLSLDRLLTSFSFELIFVKESLGTGKSALLFELNKSFVQNGKFVFGKYDCSKDEPCLDLIEELKRLCADILLKDELIIAKCQYLIQDTAGEEGKLLTNVIDNLHDIIGK